MITVLIEDIIYVILRKYKIYKDKNDIVIKTKTTCHKYPPAFKSARSMTCLQSSLLLDCCLEYTGEVYLSCVFVDEYLNLFLNCVDHFWMTVVECFWMTVFD